MSGSVEFSMKWSCTVCKRTNSIADEWCVSCGAPFPGAESSAANANAPVRPRGGGGGGGGGGRGGGGGKQKLSLLEFHSSGPAASTNDVQSFAYGGGDDGGGAGDDDTTTGSSFPESKFRGRGRGRGGGGGGFDSGGGGGGGGGRGGRRGGRYEPPPPQYTGAETWKTGRQLISADDAENDRRGGRRGRGSRGRGRGREPDTQIRLQRDAKLLYAAPVASASTVASPPLSSATPTLHAVKPIASAAPPAAAASAAVARGSTHKPAAVSTTAGSPALTSAPAASAMFAAGVAPPATASALALSPSIVSVDTTLSRMFGSGDQKHHSGAQHKSNAAAAGAGGKPFAGVKYKPAHRKAAPRTSGKRVVLIVAEKPSIAASIAGVLASGVTYEPRKGRGMTVHEFEGGPFREHKSVVYRVTSVAGHVYEVDFEPGYENWDKTDPLTLFIAPIRKTSAGRGIEESLQSEAYGADYLVLWLDCDREGENIAFEVLRNTDAWMNRPAQTNEQTIFRAKFSSVTAPDIRHALTHLVEPNLNESLAVDARQELDLRLGVAFTRFQSKYFQGKYGNLNTKLLSFGPCVTPTLGFCVARHDAIQTFVPEKYWVLSARVTCTSTSVKVADSTTGAAAAATQTLNLSWNRGRMFDEPICRHFQRLLSPVTHAVCVAVEEKTTRKERPTAINTVELLKVGSRQLNLGPAQVMRVAEGLYLGGYISYPRTESTAYPQHMNLNRAVEELSSNPHWGGYCRQLLADGLQAPKAGSDMGDHPPITPVRDATSAELHGDDWILYEYIVRHFLGSVSPDCVSIRTRARFAIGDEQFRTESSRVITPGFTAIMDWCRPQNDMELSVRNGERCPVAAIDVQTRETSCPDFLSESDLIGLMEKHGIGTDASISVHINSICEKGFVGLGAGRTLVPKPLGVQLIHGYNKIDPDLCQPTSRARVEAQLNLIAKGEAEHATVVAHVISIFAQKYAYFVSKISKMDSLFSGHFSTLEDTAGRRISTCGRCRKWMKLISMKPMRIYCPQCDESYKLPQGGFIKSKTVACPIDGFDLVQFSTGGEDGISYTLCPHCYNWPPFEGVAQGMACNTCEHPTCAHSIAKNGVMSCPNADQCGGMLMLDPSGGPNWKLGCNACNHLLKFAAQAHSVTLKGGERCGQCSALLFDVDFHKNHCPPALLGKTKHSGCVFCDPVLKATSEVGFGRLRKARASRGRGGRGRRGRGRGMSKSTKAMMKTGKDGKPSVMQLLQHHG